MPLASSTWAFAGALTERRAPTAVIFPFSITSTPFSIVPWVMVSSLAPVITMGWLGSKVGAALEVVAFAELAVFCCATAAPRSSVTTSDQRRAVFLILVPPETAEFPSRAGCDRSTHRHRSRPFPEHRRWTADSQSTARGPHPYRRQSSRSCHLLP